MTKERRKKLVIGCWLVTGGCAAIGSTIQFLNGRIGFGSWLFRVLFSLVFWWIVAWVFWAVIDAVAPRRESPEGTLPPEAQQPQHDLGIEGIQEHAPSTSSPEAIAESLPQQAAQPVAASLGASQSVKKGRTRIWVSVVISAAVGCLTLACVGAVAVLLLWYAGDDIIENLLPSFPGTPETYLEGYYRELSEPEIRVVLMVPSDWEVDAGSQTLPSSQATFQYITVFDLVDGEEYKIVTVGMIEQSFPTSPSELVEMALDFNEDKLREADVEILDYLEDISVDGYPAGGIVYRATDPRGTRFFSIVLVVSVSNRGYVLQWGASAGQESEIRAVFETMLPTIQFIE